MLSLPWVIKSLPWFALMFIFDCAEVISLALVSSSSFCLASMALCWLSVSVFIVSGAGLGGQVAVLVPNSCTAIQTVRPSYWPCPTATPISLKLGERMLARCPGLSIHACTRASSFAKLPRARFSPTVIKL